MSKSILVYEPKKTNLRRVNEFFYTYSMIFSGEPNVFYGVDITPC